MTTESYLMRDLNGRKIDAIMQFDVRRGRSRRRSIFEFSLFLGALVGYLLALTLSA